MKSLVVLLFLFFGQVSAKETESNKLFRLTTKLATSNYRSSGSFQGYNLSNEIMFSALLLSSIADDESLIYLVKLASYSFGAGPNPYIDDLLKDRKGKIRQLIKELADSSLCNEKRYVCRYGSKSSILNVLEEEHKKGFDRTGDRITYINEKLQSSCMGYLIERMENIFSLVEKKKSLRELSRFNHKACSTGNTQKQPLLLKDKVPADLS